MSPTKSKPKSPVKKATLMKSKKKSASAKAQVVPEVEVLDPDALEAAEATIVDTETEDESPAFKRQTSQSRKAEKSDDENGKSDSKSLTISDPMTLYLNEIKKYPILTPEEERKWAIEYFEKKDPKAAEILVTSNLRFVVKVAAEYSKFGARMIDLVQEGNVGLMHAVKEFNPYKGVRLITYAVWWIRGYIQEYLMRQYSMVRVGTTQNQRKLFYQLQNERKKLEALGLEPGVKLLSSRLGMPEEEVQMMAQRMQNRDVSLDQPLEDGSTSHFIDLQVQPDAVSVDEELGQREELEKLKEKLESIRDQLNEKEKYILEHRLLADTPMTLQEIGEKYGMTRERARQLEARIISKLKNAYHEGEGQDTKD